MYCSCIYNIENTQQRDEYVPFNVFNEGDEELFSSRRRRSFFVGSYLFFLKNIETLGAKMLLVHRHGIHSGL